MNMFWAWFYLIQNSGVEIGDVNNLHLSTIQTDKKAACELRRLPLEGRMKLGIHKN